MNIAHFSASFTVFLALSDPEFCTRMLGTQVGVPLVTLAGYMKFWGWVYLAVTVVLALFKKEGRGHTSGAAVTANGNAVKRLAAEIGETGREAAVGSPTATTRGIARRRSSRIAAQINPNDNMQLAFSSSAEYDAHETNGHGHGDLETMVEEQGEEEEEDIREAYAALWRVVRLPSVRLLAVMLVVCRLGMLPAETAAPLKLLEKGASKEALAGLVRKIYLYTTCHRLIF